MVDDNFVVTASNVEMSVTLGRVEVDTLCVSWNFFHNFRLNGSGFEPCKDLATASAVVALGKMLVAKRRVTHHDVYKYSLRAMPGCRSPRSTS